GLCLRPTHGGCRTGSIHDPRRRLASAARAGVAACPRVVLQTSTPIPHLRPPKRPKDAVAVTRPRALGFRTPRGAKSPAMHEDRGVEMVTAGRPPGLEQSVNAFNLLRDFSEGAIV